MQEDTGESAASGDRKIQTTYKNNKGDGKKLSWAFAANHSDHLNSFVKDDSVVCQHRTPEYSILRPSPSVDRWWQKKKRCYNDITRTRTEVCPNIVPKLATKESCKLLVRKLPSMMLSLMCSTCLIVQSNCDVVSLLRVSPWNHFGPISRVRHMLTSTATFSNILESL